MGEKVAMLFLAVGAVVLGALLLSGCAAAPSEEPAAAGHPAASSEASETESDAGKEAEDAPGDAASAGREAEKSDAGASEGAVSSDDRAEDAAQEGGSAVSEQDARVMVVRDGAGHEVSFALNESAAADDLWEQLPLEIAVENYSDDEKIFYPDALDVSDAPRADAVVGTLAYYAPWGDVVMYYRPFGAASGLYELGQAVEGADSIQALGGTLTIERG